MRRLWLVLPLALLLLGAGSCGKLGGERKIVVPAGTSFQVQLDAALDTGANRSGDAIVATTTDEVRIGPEIAIPEGATVRGTVSDVEPAGRARQRAKMTIRFEKIEYPPRSSYPLDTGANRSGDDIAASTTDPVRIGDQDVIPAGATLRGTLSDVEPAGRERQRAKMTIRFDRIEYSGRSSYPIDADPLRLEAPSETREELEKVAAGGVIGGVIGAIAGGGKGALVGGALGLGTGTAIVLGTRGEEIRLPEGQRLEVRLARDADLPVARR